MEGGKVKEENTLPPGYRFHPSDEELITYYLINKISDANFTERAVGDVDLNKCEPWDLPGKAKWGEKEWYFFSLRDRKYPTGMRTNRATNTGYWKTTGKDKEIFNSTTSELVGMKKTLVFYKGRAPRGLKSNWVMHEYRIHSKSSHRTTKDAWVVCRVFQKSGVRKYPSTHSRPGLINPYPYNNPTDIQSPQIPILQQQQILMQPAENLQYFQRRSYINSNPQDHHIQESNNSSFTISGPNFNQLINGGTASCQPLIRPAPPPGMSQEYVTTNSAGGDMNIIAGNMDNRFMGMSNFADLDHYWPPTY